MCKYIYIYIYIYTYICMYVCMYVCIWNICIHIYIYTRIHVYTYIESLSTPYTPICICTHTHTHTHHVTYMSLHTPPTRRLTCTFILEVPHNNTVLLKLPQKLQKSGTTIRARPRRRITRSRPGERVRARPGKRVRARPGERVRARTCKRG